MAHDPSRSLRIAGTETEKYTYGLFYTSTDRKKHIIPYKPYCRPPEVEEALCGSAYGIPTSTGDTDRTCQACLDEARRMFEVVEFE